MFATLSLLPVKRWISGPQPLAQRNFLLRIRRSSTVILRRAAHVELAARLTEHVAAVVPVIDQTHGHATHRCDDRLGAMLKGQASVTVLIFLTCINHASSGKAMRHQARSCMHQQFIAGAKPHLRREYLAPPAAARPRCGM